MQSGFWLSNKPPAGASLNRSHALAQGLVGAWLMAEGAGKSIADYARGGVGLATHATENIWLPARRGTGFRISTLSGNTGADIGTNTVNRLLAGAPGATLCTRIKLVTSTVGTNFSAANFSWIINSTSNGGYCGLNNVNQVWMQGRSQSADSSQTLTSAATVTVGVWVDLAYVWDYNGSRMKVAVAGIAEAWSGKTFGAATYTPGTASLGDMIGDIEGASNGGSLMGSSEYAYLYRRALSDQEIASIAFNPYQMFASPVWRRYFVVQGQPTQARWRGVPGMGRGGINWGRG